MQTMFTKYMLKVLIKKLKKQYKLKVKASDVHSDADAVSVLQQLWNAVTAGQQPTVKASDLIINTYVMYDHECGPEEMEHCKKCVFLCCRFNDDMHFHHDGCPSCIAKEKVN